MNRNDRYGARDDARTDPGFYDDFGRLESKVRRGSRAALPPRSFTAVRKDGGVEFRIIDRDPIAECNGSVRYDIYWAEDVDLTTPETVAAGFERATQVLSITAPGKEGADATRTIYGALYLRGFYYCVGVDSNNVKGTPTPPISMNDTSVGGGYPDDVLHFAVSESGEVHNGTAYSAISFVYQAPNDERFAGIELFVKDYPVINQIFQTYFHRYTGQRGGTGQGKILFEIGRKKGTGVLSIAGTAVTGVGSAFLAEMNSGDLVEARSHTQALDPMVGVTNNTVATLFVVWTGDDITSVADWWAIPEVTFYAVSIGRDGSHRDDVEFAPSDSEFLDGLLSPPVAPVLTANVDANGVSTLGEVNRLEWQQLEGTEIKAYHLYRGEGAGVAFVDCLHIGTRDHNPHAMADGHHSIDDKDFSITQKEQNQVWSYYLVAENWREQRSDPSARLEVACRLNSPPSGDPTIPARSGVLNILFDGPMVGTPGNTIDSADNSQNAFLDGSPATPAGWTRWHSTVDNGAVTRPTHSDNDQFKFVPPGAGDNIVYAFQDINAWDAATNKIIRAGAVLTFQALLKHGSGGLTDGTFQMYIEAYNGATAQEFCPRRYRDPADDALKWYAPGDSRLDIAGSDLLSTWQMFYAVFLPRTSVTTTKLRVNFGWYGGTASQIYVTQTMLSYGEELCNWTGQMIDTATRYPHGGDPPGQIGDGTGNRKPLFGREP